MSERGVLGQDQVFAGSTSGKNINGITGRKVDFLDSSSLAAAFADIDVAFILIPGHPQMVQMTANAVAAAKAAGVKHLVRLSAAGADANSSFAIAKIQGLCDDLVIQSGISYTLLRPKNFMQNLSSYQRDMIRAGNVYSSQGEGLIPFIDVRDIAEVAAKVLQNPAQHAGQAYVLTGPTAYTNTQALQIISDAIAKPVNLIHIPEAAAVAAMQQMGMPAEMVEAMSSLNQVIALGYVAEVSNSVSDITSKPARTLNDFAREYAAVWQ